MHKAFEPYTSLVLGSSPSTRTSYMNNLYFDIARLVEKQIKQSFSAVDDSLQIDLRRRIDHDENSDYDKYGAAFTNLFWLRNYWKAVYFFIYEYNYKKFDSSRKNDYKETSINILSGGAGSASDTVACMVWLNENLPLGSVVRVELLDKSQKQLEIAKDILTVVLPKLNKVKWNIYFTRVNINDWKPQNNFYQLILVSHFLTENTGKIQKIIDKFQSSLEGDGDLIVIERERDSVWKKAINNLTNSGISVYDAKVNKEKVECFYHDISLQKLDFTPQYIKATVPSLKYQSEIVVNYFTAWKHQSTELLKGIFTNDAIYDEKPGIEMAIGGLNNIIGYWEENPLRQKNINLYIRNIAHEDNLVICAFEGDFDTPKQHIVIRGAMNFYLDPYAKKIRKFVEYFGTEKSSLACKK